MTSEEAAPATLDDVVAELQTLRAAAGGPSYAEIASRISERRREAGLSEGQARIARSTVYDAFRPGRRRLDADLVAEIVTVLDGGDAERWRERVIELSLVRPPAPGPVPAAATAPVEVVERAPVHRVRHPAGVVLAILLGAIGLNLLGRVLVDTLRLQLHLDMLGTAVASIALGPWWGALVGAGTNGAGAAISGWKSLAFIPVNVAGALLWGYGVRRFAMGRSFPRFAALSVVVGVVSSLLAVPILYFFLDGHSGHAEGAVAAGIVEATGVLFLGLLVANLLTNVADKLVSGFVALALLEGAPGLVAVPEEQAQAGILIRRA